MHHEKDEKTPSFVVSPAKQIWKDFSSGRGGNVVTFLMEVEQFTYPEALRWLAKRYNIEIEEDGEYNFEQQQEFLHLRAQQATEQLWCLPVEYRGIAVAHRLQWQPME